VEDGITKLRELKFFGSQNEEDDDKAIIPEVKPESSEDRWFSGLTDLDTKAAGDPKKWRLYAQKLMLTYKTHVDKDAMREMIETKTKRPGLKFLRIAHETADSQNPYLHSHVLVDLESRFQTTNCRFFDIIDEESGETIHPHIKIVGSYQHWENSKNYIAKEDPEHADLLTKPSWVDGVLRCETRSYCTAGRSS